MDLQSVIEVDYKDVTYYIIASGNDSQPAIRKSSVNILYYIVKLYININSLSPLLKIIKIFIC